MTSAHGSAETGGRHLARRVFTAADQAAFASLTGDRNPVHLDALAARRTIVGQVVVHGVHTAAWALESHVDDRSRHADGHERVWRPEQLTVTFPKPVLLDREVEVDVVSESDDAAHLRARQDSVVVLDLRVSGAWATPVGDPATLIGRREHVPSSHPDARRPVLRHEEDLAGLDGVVELVQAPEQVAASFPRLSAALGVDAVSQVLGLSTLVGMECPGLRSLLSGIKITVRAAEDTRASADRDPPTTGPLSYAVRRFAPTFGLVDITVESSGVTGVVTAFLRPPPAAQPSARRIAAHVAREEFAAQRALVVGGSRGLGELTAKIVAAGGGAVVITYRRGQDDAQQVADDIRAEGGRCVTAPFDVLDVAGSMDRLRDAVMADPHSAGLWPPTHVYYFATPRIFVRRAGRFDQALFAAFADFYVRGFSDVVDACSASASGPIRVLYPSTVAIDEGLAELAEYAAAKAAGEALARVVDVSTRDHVAVVRLPRLPTDQTVNVQNTPADDPLPVMYDAIRRLGSDAPD